MSFIYLDKEKEEVRITDEGMTLPPVIALSKVDKTEGKKQLKKAIKYIYYVYHVDSPFQNKLPDDRRIAVCNTFFEAIDPEKFEGNRLVQDIIAIFIDLSVTPIEQLYERLKMDIQDILKRISMIPFYKDVFVEIDTVVETNVEHEGQVITVNIPIKKKVKIQIDNSKEKYEAIKLNENLFKQEAQLSERIGREKITGHKKRIFDQK